MKNIIVIVEGGVIQNILNIPEDLNVEVHDYDVDEEDDGYTRKDEDGNMYFCGIW